MTSSDMESPSWKQLLSQAAAAANGQTTANYLNMNDPQQQQQQIASQNMRELNQMFMASQSSSSAPSSSSSSVSPSGSTAKLNGHGMIGAVSNTTPAGQAQGQQQRELGFIEKVHNNYGFIKPFSKDYSLPFVFTANMSEVKVGDIVEYEEMFDKRYGKSMAVNLTKQANSTTAASAVATPVADQPPQAISNLKDLLMKADPAIAANSGFTNQSNQANQIYSQQEQSYNYLINGLKMLNIQKQHQQQQLQSEQNTMSNLNSLLSLINNKGSNGNLQNYQQQIQQQQQQQLQMLTNQLANSKAENLISNEYLEGNVVSLATKRANLLNLTNNIAAALDGRITYQQNGEAFYIPYSISDVLSMPNQQQPVINLGDRVRFNVAVHPLGIYYACRIEPISASSAGGPGKLYRGIITSLKDSFGKIEREDLLKETFFHFSEYRGSNPNEELRIGLNVEFEIQDRYGKEIAANITRLPDGTVCFDELSAQIYIGRITQAPIRLTNGSVTLGRLVYDNNQDSLVELTFSDTDRVLPSSLAAPTEYTNKYTLLEGDFVQFRIASDKRRKFQTQTNNIQRASQVTLIEEHSLVNNVINTGERREKGVLIKISELIQNAANNSCSKYGAIKCLEREDLVYFPFSEVINYARFKDDETKGFLLNRVKLEVGDSLEFSVMTCQPDQIFQSGFKAIRIRQLAKNSVKFELISAETFTGYVEKEAIYTTNPEGGSTNGDAASINEANCGIIRYEVTKNGVVQIKKILFSYQNQDQSGGSSISTSSSSQDLQQDQQSESSGAKKPGKTLFYFGDKVQFNILNCVRNSQQYAVNVKTIEQRKEQGYITIVKESYGFIEINCLSNVPPPNCKINSLPRDIFFHFSSLNGCSGNDLEVGDEVEFLINRKTKQKLCAESVCKLPTGTITPAYTSLPTIYKGRVIQSLRSNQDQKEDAYYGKIAVLGDKGSSTSLSSSNEHQAAYQFGVFSLNDKKTILQTGDIVSFQLIECQDSTGSVKRAYNVQLVQAANPASLDLDQSSGKKDLNGRSRETKKGKVDSLKGHCGFIDYSANGEAKKVFFHISDVVADSSSSSTEIPQIKPGDEVEFQLSHNSRNGKISAIKIKRTSPSYSNGAYSNGSSGSSVNNNSSSSSSQQATTSNTTTSSNSSNSNNGGGESEKRERLNLKLKIANIDEKSGRELLLTRQPLNPDEHNKSKSFTRTLQKRSPGMLSGASSSSKSSLVSNSSSGALSSTTTTATSNNDNQQQQLHQSSSSVSILELLMNSDMSSLKQ